MTVREVLDEHSLRGYPKTSGSRGIHVYVRVAPERDFHELRRAALALAREVERRMPGRATSKWWKEEREGVFIDYNQNARDRTIASAYSVRAVPDARVSCPLEWDEVPTSTRGAAHRHGPGRLRELGDPAASIDEHAGRWRRCWSWRRATNARGSETHRGRRTSASSARSRAAYSRAEPAAREPAAAAAARAGARAHAQGAAGRRGLRLRAEARRLSLHRVCGRRGGLPAVPQRQAAFRATSRSSHSRGGRMCWMARS